MTTPENTARRPAPNPASQAPAPAMAAPQYPQAAGPVVRKQGAWGLWWLCLVTLGVYYYVWYHRINKELAAVLGTPVPANGQWWNQLIPIWNLVGLGATAKRLNAAHVAVGSPTRVGLFVTWFWAPAWFASQTRYLQRRINILHDVLASHSAMHTA
jgi:hypothetical protein